MAFRLKLSISRPLFFALLAVNGMVCTDGASAERIPEVHSTSLMNEAVNLPAALQGKVGVLVIGFSRGSRDAVTVWGRRLAADYRDSPAVMYYEMPVLASVPGMLRGMVVRSMRSSVPERAQARFVPITDQEKAWRQVTHYGNPDDPYVLVVNSQGDVEWQTQGPATDATYAALKQHVESLKAPGAH
jgi:hypothetical protein